MDADPVDGVGPAKVLLGVRPTKSQDTSDTRSFPPDRERTNDCVLLTEMKDGTMTGKNPRPVRGLYRMEGGVHIKSSADAAILDGVVGLNLDGAEKTQARR